MTNDIVDIILGEGTWLPVAMTAGLAAVAALYARHRAALPARQLITAMMNLFSGVTLAIMGGAHLLAVSIRFIQGSLEGSPWLLYPIGIAVVVPAWLVARHTRRLVHAAADRQATIRLNAWLAATLVILGLVNIPLAIAPLLTVAYRVHARRGVGLAIVAAAVIVNAGLLVGGWIFMASGQTFEQFSGTQ